MNVIVIYIFNYVKILGGFYMKIGIFWRRFRNVEQQMKFTPDEVYDDAYEEAYHHYCALKKAGYDAVMIEWKQDPIETFKDIEENDVDIVFNASSLREVAFLETFEIPYVGSGLDLVSLNKATRKELVAYNGLPTPKFTVAKSVDKIPEIELKYPLFVKPIEGRGSAGIDEENIIHEYEQLPKVVDKITTKLGQAALIEEFIEGREITVGIIGYYNPEVLPIVEIQYNSAKTNTFQHKMYDNEIIECPAEFPKEVENNIKDIALKIYKILNAKDYARIDMIVGKDNVPYFLEINTYAGLTMESRKSEEGKIEVHHGYMGYSAKAAGMDAPEFLSTILESAIERYNCLTSN